MVWFKKSMTNGLEFFQPQIDWLKSYKTTLMARRYVIADKTWKKKQPKTRLDNLQVRVFILFS